MPYRLRSGPRPHSRSRAAASTTFSASLVPKSARPTPIRPSATSSPSPQVLNLAFGSHPFPRCSFLKSTNCNFAEALRPSGTKIPADAASRAAGFAGLGAAAWLLIAVGKLSLYTRHRRRIVSPATQLRQPKNFEGGGHCSGTQRIAHNLGTAEVIQ